MYIKNFKKFNESKSDSVNEFHELLTSNNYKFTIIDGKTIVDVLGDINLPNLKTIPKNANISAGGYIDLPNLKTIPENTTLSAGGDLYLYNLTTIPENTTISAGGYLNLYNLITIPENTTLSAGDNLSLGNLTTIPEGMKFDTKKLYIPNVNLSRFSYNYYKYIYDILEPELKEEYKDYWYSEQYWKDLGEDYLKDNLNRIYKEIKDSGNFKALTDMKKYYPDQYIKIKDEKTELGTQMGELD